MIVNGETVFTRQACCELWHRHNNDFIREHSYFCVRLSVSHEFNYIVVRYAQYHEVLPILAVELRTEKVLLEMSNSGNCLDVE